MVVDSKRALRALNVRIPVTLFHRIGVYCVEHDLTLREFVIAAVESHLERLTRPTHRQGGASDPAPNKGHNAASLTPDETIAKHGADKTANENLARVGQVLGLSRTDLRALLGIPANRIDAPQTWSQQSHASLLHLAELADRLEDTFESASIHTWLHSPSRDLHWRIPFDLLRNGQIDPVNAALEAIDSGVYV